jgi:lysyl-tRNA synthetase class 2
VRKNWRHRAREAALQILYQWEIGKVDVERAVETFFLQWPNTSPPPDDLRTFASTLARDTVARLAAIDPLIADTAERWRPERMAVIDRLILRMAISELTSQAETPHAVVINEALELARTFSTEDAVKFINGMLDAIRKKIDSMSGTDSRDATTKTQAITPPIESQPKRQMTSQEEQIQQRRANLGELVKLGVDVYPHVFVRRHTISQLARDFGPRSREELDAERIETVTSGRILAIRSFGKANFLVLSDGVSKVQIYVRQDSMPSVDFQVFKLLDIGDWVGVEGYLFRTKTNEFSIWASRLHFLSKCLLPLPEKWHGLTDVEIRYRQRYLDLIVNPDSRSVFETRSRIVVAIRAFMTERGYVEVETPMMQPIAGGALARPFVTHHNTLDMDLYLRVAPELYLKRLTVGGFERVFEINRNFRNEGISTQHNPEFTMMEFYEAYSDYRALMTMTEEMIQAVAHSVLGTDDVQFGDHRISLKAPFARISLREAARAAASRQLAGDVTESDLRHPEQAAAIARQVGVEIQAGYGAGKITTGIFEALCEDQLIQPTFVYDFPTEVSPLAKQKPDDPETVERFELYIGGFEVANAFSELNDPDEQRRRFDAQLKDRARGDLEAHEMDEDYIRALEYGLPPAAGEGVGIDRLVMLLTNSSSIRDVILFPLMRKRDSGPVTNN